MIPINRLGRRKDRSLLSAVGLAAMLITSPTSAGYGDVFGVSIYAPGEDTLGQNTDNGLSLTDIHGNVGRSVLDPLGQGQVFAFAVAARSLGAGYYTTRFQLDPVQAGEMALLQFTYRELIKLGLGGFPGAKSEVENEAGVFVGTTSFSLYHRQEIGPFPFDELISTMPASATLSVKGGDFVQIFASGRAGAYGGDVPDAVPPGTFAMNLNSGNGFAISEQSFDYTLTLIEDRRHWAPEAAAPWKEATSWLQQAAPDAASWAVFNRVVPRQLALTPLANERWRGLIVDGEIVNLDLAGKTLALGIDGPSQKTYNILVGEGRDTASALTMRNGVLTFEKDIVVGGTSKNSAALTLDTGLVATATGSGTPAVVVGAKGNGTLTVKGGSRLTTAALILAANDPEPAIPRASSIIGAVEITGAGSQITSILASVGERGEGSLAIRDGGTLQAQTLKLGAQANANGSITIEGAGSKLLLTGGFADIGLLGRGSVEVNTGGLIDGNGTKINVGAGNAAQFSVLRLKDVGSTMADAGVTVNDGGLFEVRDGASWSLSQPNFFSMTGGTTTFQNATVSVVDATFSGGILNVNSGATFEVTSTIHTSADGPGAPPRIIVNGTNARLFGFDRFQLTSGAELNVSNGGEIFGNTIFMDRSGILTGDLGIIRARVENENGVVKPGNSAGTLTIDGDLTMGSGATLTLEIGGLAGGSQYDQLIVTGDVMLNGGRIVLSFVNGFAPLATQTFSLLQVGGTFTSTASFEVTGLESGWEFATSFDPAADSFTLTSLTNGVAVVSEPPTWGFMVAGLALAALRSRRVRASLASEPGRRDEVPAS